MAALCTGTSYGLSNLRANDNKDLIFVKLTDSAFRAIEEYNRNKVSRVGLLDAGDSAECSGVGCHSSSNRRPALCTYR